VAHPLNVDPIVAAVRSALDAEMYVRAFSAGRAMGFDAAVADAVSLGHADDYPKPGVWVNRTKQRRVPTVDPVNLTWREQEVLDLLCQRRTNAEMAAALFLSPRTIETHVTRVMNKLGATNRREAAALAVRRGLVPPVTHSQRSATSATNA
jgi:DNA-binding NarL/FixJ family response regulator